VPIRSTSGTETGRKIAYPWQWWWWWWWWWQWQHSVTCRKQYKAL